MKGLKDMYQCLISFSPDFYFLKTVICLFERQSGRQETEGERESPICSYTPNLAIMTRIGTG